MLGAAVEPRTPARHALFLGLAAVTVPPLACALSPWVQRYAGLSGLVLGQLALLLTCFTRQAAATRQLGRLAFGSFALAALFAKQGHELIMGDTSIVTLSYETFHTVPAAHLVSVLCGVVAGGVSLSCTKREKARAITNVWPDATEI